MIFVLSVNSYFLLIIIKIVNILVIIFLQNNYFNYNYNISENKMININFGENSYYVNKTLIQIQIININNTNNSTNNNNYFDNPEISLSIDLNKLTEFMLNKKLIWIGINFALFVLFCLINRAFRISFISKFKYEQLMSFTVIQEKNLCLTLNKTKKIIFKNNQIVKNEYLLNNSSLDSFNSSISLFDVAKQEKENMKIDINNINDNINNQSNNKNKLTNTLKNYFCKNKNNENSLERVHNNSIDDSINKKLYNQAETILKNFPGTGKEAINKNKNNNIANDDINIISNTNNKNDKSINDAVNREINIENDVVTIKIIEKQLSESIDVILNNPNSYLMKQMENLSFFKFFLKLNNDENIFGCELYSKFNTSNNSNWNNIINNKNKNTDEFKLEKSKAKDPLNHFNSNNYSSRANNSNNNIENLSLRVMPRSQVYDTKDLNIKTNPRSILYDDIINLVINRIYYKDQKSKSNKYLNSDFNLSNFDKNINKYKNKDNIKYTQFKSSKAAKQSYCIGLNNLNSYCYLGTYFKKPNESSNFQAKKIHPTNKEYEANKFLKIIKVFYKETKIKKLNFIQFFFQEVNLHVENLKNFCNKNLNCVTNEESGLFNSAFNKIINHHQHNKHNMELKSGEDFAYFSINDSNNKIIDSGLSINFKKNEFLLKEKLEKTKSKKYIVKKNLFNLKNIPFVCG